MTVVEVAVLAMVEVLVVLSMCYFSSFGGRRSNGGFFDDLLQHRLFGLLGVRSSVFRAPALRIDVVRTACSRTLCRRTGGTSHCMFSHSCRRTRVARTGVVRTTVAEASTPTSQQSDLPSLRKTNILLFEVSVHHSFER